MSEKCNSGDSIGDTQDCDLGDTPDCDIDKYFLKNEYHVEKLSYTVG